MMRYLFVIILITACTGNEQVATVATETRPNNNPLFSDIYTADPAALVYQDTFYLYTGHDEQASNQEGFLMNNWLVFSTTDMVNWDRHGPRLRTIDFAWSRGEAWAAHVVEKDGKFYWYVTVEHGSIPGKSIGVAVADHPTGPWRDAIGAALITNDMTTHTDIFWDDIDPAVFLDDNGEAFIYWGNTVLKYARLKDNMIEIEGDIHVIDVPSFTEGPWVFKRDSIYYLTYSALFPEVIDYATAPTPEGPWTYQGRLNDTVPNSPTNHQAVLEYKGDWYFVYHNGILPQGGEYRRSVCIDYLYWNEDGTMKEIVQTRKGVSAISKDD